MAHRTTPQGLSPLARSLSDTHRCTDQGRSERRLAEPFDGTCRIRRAPGSGTLVSWTVPLVG
ncbi:MAG TPA: hypothetical protein VK453_04570 [Micromonosporaceae bacterium]|nr:hypothetical protein [Micromonosporaceae bacterium]